MFSFSLAVFLAAGLFWAVPASAQRVRVATPAKSLTFLNFYVGEKFGSYKAEGLNISLEVVTPKIAISGLLSGDIDYTTAIGSTMRAAATGTPVKALTFSMDRVVLFMLAKPEFKRIEDLKGRKNIVAVTDIAATPAFAAIAMARAHGVDPEKELTFVSMGTVPNALAALQGGSADVAILSIPFNFKAEALGFRNLGSAVDYMRTPFAGVGATVAKVKSNPDQVKRMLRGTLKSLEFTLNPANREKVVGLIMEEFKLVRQDADRALTESVKAFSRDGIMPDDAVKAEIEELRKRLKIKGEISISQLVDYTLLKEVLAEMKR
jgi:ABC-type nitrate/sulfonate/bicarbonate transport system substrate-binding protein